MKRLFLLTILALVIPLSAIAQTASGSLTTPPLTGTSVFRCPGPNGDLDGDGIPNRLDKDVPSELRAGWAQRGPRMAGSLKNTPNPYAGRRFAGNGKCRIADMEDGTKGKSEAVQPDRPRPRDGTGFGAQASPWKGKGKGVAFSQGKGPCRGWGRGSGNGRCRRDGSCMRQGN